VPNSGATEHNTRFLSALDGSPPPVSMPQAAAALARNGDVAGLREALASGSPLAGLLHIAAEERHVEILEVLVEAGAPLDDVDEDGQTPLHVAVASGHVEAAEVLSREQPCLELRVPDKYRMTPLHLACESDEAEMLALVLARGGDEIIQGRRASAMASGRAISSHAPAAADASSPSASVGLSLDAQLERRSSHPSSGGSSRWSSGTDDSLGFLAQRHSSAHGVELLRRASRGHVTQLPRRLSDVCSRTSGRLGSPGLAAGLSELSIATTHTRHELKPEPAVPTAAGGGRRGERAC